MFEALSGTEREQLAQYQILKETLDNASQELAQKHAQVHSEVLLWSGVTWYSQDGLNKVSYITLVIFNQVFNENPGY